MLDWNDAKPLIRLAEFVKAQGNSKDAKIIYSNHGTKLTYDQVWFTGDFRVDKHRISGRDWSFVISLFDCSKIGTGETLTVRTPMVFFDGKSKRLVGLEVSNRPAMERDIALLRVFGVEELFAKL